MKETIDFLYQQTRALQKKVELLEKHNDILFDYADKKMVEGCEDAQEVINEVLKR
jgi:hypothetical protein|tara:strand:- start:16259 stop:16423 length:165 start_codon:yes stop_codon:yes gene_type:complete